MRTLGAALAALLATAANAADLTAGAMDAARYDGGAVPEGQSALTARVQVLLDRAHISPGVIDGYKGGMTATAISAFEAREGLKVDGELDAEVWSRLGGGDGPVTKTYEITEDDAAGLVDRIPDHIRDKAAMKALAHTSVAERLAERFHMDVDFLRLLNPDAAFEPGETIRVADSGARLEASVARIEVDASDRRLRAFGADGAVLADYPVSVGSAKTPSPRGETTVRAIAIDPIYTYDPDENFTVDGVKEALSLPPGPNGPVGSVWIDLEIPTFGIHGTPDPAKLFTEASHGCVRMTNWDADELAHLVEPGVKVEIRE